MLTVPRLKRVALPLAGLALAVAALGALDHPGRILPTPPDPWITAFDGRNGWALAVDIDDGSIDAGLPPGIWVQVGEMPDRDLKLDFVPSGEAGRPRHLRIESVTPTYAGWANLSHLAPALDAGKYRLILSTVDANDALATASVTVEPNDFIAGLSVTAEQARAAARKTANYWSLVPVTACTVRGDPVSTGSWQVSCATGLYSATWWTVDAHTAEVSYFGDEISEPFVAR